MLNPNNNLSGSSFSIVRQIFLLLIAGLILSGNIFAQTEISYSEAFASLKTNRDRLMAYYASTHGYMSATDAWDNMSASQKGIFLTITDYLGRRTYMNFNQNYDIIYGGDEDDKAFGCSYLNDGNDSCKNGCNIHPVNYYGPSCMFVTGEECVREGKCSVTEFPRTDHDLALNHVTALYAVNGQNGSSCRGIEYNRVFFHADDTLIYYLRNIQIGLPEWDTSQDLGGPHSPFTQSREGTRGQPRGQTQEWAWDYEASYLTRNGVYGIYDPQIVEMDIDYNSIHDSSSECYYGGTYGRIAYQNHYQGLGMGGSAELDYYPTN